MDKVEARAILDRRIDELRQQSYEELRDTYLAQADGEDHYGPSGTWYQAEIVAYWDDEEARHLHVFVSIDDGGWRSVGASFIVAPDGSFVGE